MRKNHTSSSTVGCRLVEANVNRGLLHTRMYSCIHNLVVGQVQITGSKTLAVIIAYGYAWPIGGKPSSAKDLSCRKTFRQCFERYTPLAAMCSRDQTCMFSYTRTW